MAHRKQPLGENLKPLSELSNYTVEKGDPDPRGYTVIASDGRKLGRVKDLIVDTGAMKVRHLLVDLADDVRDRDEDRTILVPARDVDVRPHSKDVLVRTGIAPAEQAYQRSPAVERDETLTRAEEELHIGKRQVSREARVSKRVETEHVSQPVTRRREEVVVERRPVEPGTRVDATFSENEVRVPLVEEELVVEKRPVVKEELVVSKRVVEERETVEADLRRERFDVEKSPDTRPDIRTTRRDR